LSTTEKKSFVDKNSRGKKESVRLLGDGEAIVLDPKGKKDNEFAGFAEVSDARNLDERPAHLPDDQPPGSAPPGANRQRRRRDDSHQGALVPREDLSPAHLPYLQAINEAYQPVLEGEVDGLDIARYWRIVNRHKWGIISVTLIVLVIGFLNALLKTPIYRAQTTLVAEPFQRKVTLKEEYINNAAVYLFYDTQFDIIRSRAIAERVVDDLGLVEQARKAEEELAQASNEPKGNLAVLAEAVRGWLDWRRWLGGTQQESDLAPPSNADLRKSLVETVRSSVSVQGGKQSQIINISYEDADAREAARRANAVAKAYVGYGSDIRFQTSQRTNEWLQDQIVEVRDDLKQAEGELLAYQKNTGMIASSDRQAMMNDSLEKLNEQLVDAIRRRSEAQLRYEQVRNITASNLAKVESIESFAKDFSVNRILIEIRDAQRQVGELKGRVTEEHPLFKEARLKVLETQLALMREISAVTGRLRSEFEVASAQQKEIQQLIQNEKKEIGDTTADALELVRLERNVENQRGLYEALLVRLQETDVTNDLDASNIQILDAASAPLVPFKPNKVRIMMLAGILGLGLGILLAFLREHLDRTLKTLDDIEEKFGITALGMVPLIKGKKHHRAESYYLDNPRSPFAEKINHIRTSLLFSSIDNPPRTILITSATGGEGKTTLATNLAASFSQLDRTLLLEVDLRKPALAARLGIANTQGLTDLLADLDLANEVINPVLDSDKLFLLTCGTHPPNPLELLSSQRFRQVLEKLQEHFRYIVLDGPPLLAVSDAAVLGHLADTTILAARFEATSTKMVKDALSLMRKARVDPEGVVLAQADTKRMAYYGGHYYHWEPRIIRVSELFRHGSS